MSKTPYEIRLELLRLAKDSLFESIYAKRDAMMQKYQAQRETQISGSSVPRFPTLPGFPSTEDVVKEAEKLNSFISKQ